MYVCSIFRQHVLGGSHFSASLCQSTGEENASIIWTSDSGGTMQFLSWLRSTGLTLHPLKDTKGWAGVCPTNLCTCALWIWQSHSNEFFKTSCCPEGVLWEYKVFGFLLRFFWSLNSHCQSSIISQTRSQWALDSVRAALCHRFG